jgi:putative transposase
MARHLRLILPGYPHHVTARGNFRAPIFFCDEDRDFYLRLLERASLFAGVEIHGYCLMPNHVHLVAFPTDEDSFCRLFHSVHTMFARVMNGSQSRSGHLFERRYFSAAMDTSHYWNALIYVEQNPVRARMVEDAATWKWSSARAHLGLEKIDWLEVGQWRESQNPHTWGVLLKHGLQSGELLLRIREATCSGWPLGDEAFLDRIETEFRVPARPKKPGPKTEHAKGEIGARHRSPGSRGGIGTIW